MDDRVIIFDTTLRDGEQSPGASLNMEEKLEVARQLARLGVNVIEAGFPITSPDDFEAVDRVSREVKGLTVCGLARCVQVDIERAAQALQHADKPRIHTFIGTSDIHMKHQLRKTPEEVLVLTRLSVRLAKSFVEDVEFSPMDAGRTRTDFLYQVLAVAIEEGATTLNIPDTVGYTTPAEFGALIRGIRENVPGIEQAIISVHCHNDLGMATALSLAAVKEGARQVECTVNGIGERAGNAALEEIVMALQTRKDYFNVSTGIDTSQIYKTSRLVSSLTGIVVQPNKAVVGSNAFAHESGIHQDGILKEHSTFEIMQPSDIGLVQSALVLGKHSGRHALRARLAEMGYNLDGSELDRVFIRFKEVADKKKEVGERDLEAIVSDEVYTPVELVRLDQVQVTSGDHAIPTATVRMVDENGHDAIGASTGTGPVDAIYRAVNQVVRVPNRLVEYSVKSVTSGIDAIGEVTVRVEHEGRTYIGHGANTDIMVASARAYVNALNRLLATKPKVAS